ncbi:TPA: ead/Ea22-like family protein [Klebsiella pneumoniae]|nr:ead/Ea22-like family protein [Klebsiella pneumoniae]
MTTDITELAQSLKAAAEKATPGPWEVQFGEEIYATDGVDNEQVAIATLDARDADYIALANPANVLALIEALEKAQQRIGKLEKKITDHKRMNQEMAKAMLTPNDSDAAGMEIAALRQRIAGLESRTVTVKLPDIMPPEAAPAHYWGSGESMAYADGYNKSAADLKTSFALSCSSAGVNVEFE